MYISSANKSDLSYLSPSSPPCQVKMGLHSYSCLYGTLLGNSMKERDGARIRKRTLSLWSLLNPRNPEVVNHLFTTAGPRVSLKIFVWCRLVAGAICNRFLNSL